MAIEPSREEGHDSLARSRSGTGQMQGAPAAGCIEGGRASRRQESVSPFEGRTRSAGFDTVSKQRATGRALLLPPSRFGSEGRWLC